MISASSLPPTSGRSARSLGPGVGHRRPRRSLLSALLTGTNCPPFDPCALKRTHCSRQRTLSVPTRARSMRLYSVGIGVVSNALRFGCAARGRGSQASAQSRRARSGRPGRLRCLVVRGPRELGQAGRDVFDEVQGPGEITDGASRVSGEEADDARLAIALSAASECASGARAPRSRTPYRPHGGGGWATF